MQYITESPKGLHVLVLYKVQNKNAIHCRHMTRNNTYTLGGGDERETETMQINKQANKNKNSKKGKSGGQAHRHAMLIYYACTLIQIDRSE